MSRRTALLAFLLVAAAVAVWRLTRPAPPSDQESIRRLYDDAVRAAEERRVSDAVAGLSERFQGQGLDKRGVKQLVAGHALRGNWLVVRMAGLRIEVTGDSARAVLDLVATRAGAGKALADLLPADGNAWRVDCRLEREPEGWRIVGATWREESLVEALEGSPPAGPETPGAPPPGDAAPAR
jgi:hypothetical protein